MAIETIKSLFGGRFGVPAFFQHNNRSVATVGYPPAKKNGRSVEPVPTGGQIIPTPFSIFRLSSGSVKWIFLAQYILPELQSCWRVPSKTFETSVDIQNLGLF